VIVLDTNVISELLRPEPDARVLSWMGSQPRAELYTTRITQAEILLGLALLPNGKRKAALESAVAAIFAEELAGRILPFDGQAAQHYARIAATRRSVGRPIDGFDALIAATALAFDADVATRDIAGFLGCDVPLVNPWEVQPMPM